MVFERLDGLYEYGARYLKTTGRSLNLAFTPEIVGTGIEIVNELVFTSFGSILMSLVEAAGLVAASAFAPMNDFDREVVLNIAGHLASRGLKALAPERLAMSMAEAESLGRSLASFNVEGLKASIVKPTFEVEATLEGLKRQIESLLRAPSAPSETMPEEKPATEVPTIKGGKIY